MTDDLTQAISQIENRLAVALSRHQTRGDHAAGETAGRAGTGADGWSPRPEVADDLLQRDGRAIGEEAWLVGVRHHQPHAQRQDQQSQEQDSQKRPTCQPQNAQGNHPILAVTVLSGQEA